MEGTAGEAFITTGKASSLDAFPLFYRIFSIEMINPNPSPTWRTAFGLSSIAISGQNRFFRPHSPIPQGGGVRGDSLRVPPAGFQSTSPQAGHFQTIDCYGGKNIILKNKSQILKE